MTDFSVIPVQPLGRPLEQPNDRLSLTTEVMLRAGAFNEEAGFQLGTNVYDASMSAPGFVRAIQDGFQNGFTSQAKARALASLVDATHSRKSTDIAAFQSHLLEWSLRSNLAKDFKEAGQKLVDGLNELTTKA